jgi:hypothetical protein
VETEDVVATSCASRATRGNAETLALLKNDVAKKSIPREGEVSGLHSVRGGGQPAQDVVRVCDIASWTARETGYEYGFNILQNKYGLNEIK